LQQKWQRYAHHSTDADKKEDLTKLESRLPHVNPPKKLRSYEPSLDQVAVGPHRDFPRGHHRPFRPKSNPFPSQQKKTSFLFLVRRVLSRISHNRSMIVEPLLSWQLWLQQCLVLPSWLPAE